MAAPFRSTPDGSGWICLEHASTVPSGFGCVHRRQERYYAFDICPGFWNGVLREHHDGRVRSIDRIKNELLLGRKDEDLVLWVTNEVPPSFFGDSNADQVSSAFADVMLWVQRTTQYLDRAKAKFATEADGWLVAYSMVNESTVVTNEQPRPESRSRGRSRGAASSCPTSASSSTWPTRTRLPCSENCVSSSSLPKGDPVQGGDRRSLCERCTNAPRSAPLGRKASTCTQRGPRFRGRAHHEGAKRVT
ncbi:MAG TPA: DUF4411 family protein [Gammaproteobacteria bacterium]